MNLLAMLMLQESTDGSSAAGGAMATVMIVVWAAIVILLIAAMWKVFEKAGEPGWAALIPIYNAFVLLKIAGKPMWWFILFLVPIVNIVITIMVLISLAKNFGKGTGFAFGLLILPPIFYPMLAWGDARYQRTA